MVDFVHLAADHPPDADGCAELQYPAPEVQVLLGDDQGLLCQLADVPGGGLVPVLAAEDPPLAICGIRVRK